MTATRPGRLHPVPAPDPGAGRLPADRDALRTALKRTASALKADGVPFALAGGYALWAHGAPGVGERRRLRGRRGGHRAGGQGAGRAPGSRSPGRRRTGCSRSAATGARSTCCTGSWGEPVEPELLARSAEMDLLGIRMPVLPATDLLTASCGR